MSKTDWTPRAERALGAAIKAKRPLSGGSVATVLKLDLADGRSVVAKVGGPSLDVEGWMLGELAGKLPVPAVLLAEPDLLVIEYVEAGDGLDDQAQTHAGELIAALHAHSAPAYGLARDTLIGGLVQPNGPMESWTQFFAERRLLFMAEAAHQEGVLEARLLHKIEKLAGRLDRWIVDPARPSLLHGDLWGGNVLARKGKIAAFLDPAISYGDPEIELAFATLFNTMGKPFFDAYQQRHPIRPGFFEARRDLYNLYPLLVHVRLFGGAYVSPVERVVGRFLG
ncbi:MAG: fructosamine kinase family protein [Rhodospirillales bacterium]|nr:fructosamine kinase family protein [Rhodospirillales bacterium]